MRSAWAQGVAMAGPFVSPPRGGGGGGGTGEEGGRVHADVAAAPTATAGGGGDGDGGSCRGGGGDGGRGCGDGSGTFGGGVPATPPAAASAFGLSPMSGVTRASAAARPPPLMLDLDDGFAHFLADVDAVAASPRLPLLHDPLVAKRPPDPSSSAYVDDGAGGYSLEPGSAVSESSFTYSSPSSALPSPLGGRRGDGADVTGGRQGSLLNTPMTSTAELGVDHLFLAATSPFDPLNAYPGVGSGGHSHGASVGVSTDGVARAGATPDAVVRDLEAVLTTDGGGADDSRAMVTDGEWAYGVSPPGTDGPLRSPRGPGASKEVGGRPIGTAPGGGLLDELSPVPVAGPSEGLADSGSSLPHLGGFRSPPPSVGGGCGVSPATDAGGRAYSPFVTSARRGGGGDSGGGGCGGGEQAMETVAVAASTAPAALPPRPGAGSPAAEAADAAAAAAAFEVSPLLERFLDAATATESAFFDVFSGVPPRPSAPGGTTANVGAAAAAGGATLSTASSLCDQLQRACALPGMDNIQLPPSMAAQSSSPSGGSSPCSASPPPAPSVSGGVGGGHDGVRGRNDESGGRMDGSLATLPPPLSSLAGTLKRDVMVASAEVPDRGGPPPRVVAAAAGDAPPSLHCHSCPAVFRKQHNLSVCSGSWTEGSVRQGCWKRGGGGGGVKCGICDGRSSLLVLLCE